MSAHRTLNDLFRAFDSVGPGRLNDPGDAGTITVGMWGQICSVTTAGASETRILAAPTKPGILCAVVHDTDGGDFTLTVNPTSGTVYGYNTNLDSTIAMTAASNFAVFYSIKVGTEYVWRLVKEEGTDATSESLSLADDDILTLGTGNDVQLKWNGTYLEGGPATGMWADAPSPADSQYHVACHEIFDDFHKLDTTATVGGWAAFVVGTGTTALANTVAGGQLVMTCQATTDDAAEQIIYVSAPIMLAAGKTIWYETRLKQTGDVQSECSFGLASLGEDLTAVADVYPEDGISFAHQDASLALALTASKGGVNTGAVAGVHTMVTATWATYGLLIDGVTSVTPYINGVAGTAATATIPDDTSLAPYFLIRNGDATTAQILTVDYVKAVQLR